MKTNFKLILFLSIGIFLQSQAQDFSKEFGKFTNDDKALTTYEPDKDAEAVVLFDIGKSYFEDYENTYILIFERKTRIKILSDAGIKWAKIEIPVYQRKNLYEKVYDLEAYSYNLKNGKLHKTPINTSNVFMEKIDNHWNMKKIAIPNVKKGSIIEYSYKISSSYVFNLRDWNFQWKIPVVYSEYETRMIPFYEYAWILQGANKLDIFKSYKDTKGKLRQAGNLNFYDFVYKFGAKNVPAFKDEAFITSVDDYIMKVDFQLSKINYLDGTSENIITTWKDLNEELLQEKYFGKFLNKTQRTAKNYINVDHLKFKTDKEKFNAVLDYVKNSYKWNYINSKFADKLPNDFAKAKYGNSAEINLFTTGLLKAVGIDAKPVIISTRKHGKIRYDYPYSHFFNYVIILAKINGKTILTDATEALNTNYRIPSRCINDKGLIVQENKEEWVSLKTIAPSEKKIYIKSQFDNNELISNILTTATEYDALKYRKLFNENNSNFKKVLQKNDTEIVENSIKIKNLRNKNKALMFVYDQTSNPDVINNKIYISPFMNEIIRSNPLKQKERSYPIDMTYPKKRIFSFRMPIPKGYKIDYLPIAEKINNDLFELAYIINKDDKGVSIRFNYYFKKSVYPPEDYLKIKSYFDKIVEKGNDKVVFKKI